MGESRQQEYSLLAQCFQCNCNLTQATLHSVLKSTARPFLQTLMTCTEREEDAVCAQRQLLLTRSFMFPSIMILTDQVSCVLQHKVGVISKLSKLKTEKSMFE